MDVAARMVHRIAAIDDHELILEGYRTAFSPHGFDCIATATSVSDFLASEVDPADCALVMLDLAIEGEDSSENVSSLVAHGFKVAILTQHYEPYPLSCALDAGAVALFAKNDNLVAQAELMRAICEGLGDGVCTPFMATVYNEALHLTPREIEVLRSFLTSTAGKTARKHFIAQTTVESHIKKIKEKFKDRDPSLTGTFSKSRLQRLADQEGFL